MNICSETIEQLAVIIIGYRKLSPERQIKNTAAFFNKFDTNFDDINILKECTELKEKESSNFILHKCIVEKKQIT